MKGSLDDRARILPVFQRLARVDLHQLPWAWCGRKVPSRMKLALRYLFFQLCFRLTVAGVRCARCMGVSRSSRSAQSVALVTLFRLASALHAGRVVGDIERYRRPVLRVVSPPTGQDLVASGTLTMLDRHRKPLHVWIAHADLTVAQCRRVVFYIHGGGFAKGDLAAFQHACAAFSRELDALVAFPLYPLCPEQPIARMVRELRASYQSIQQQLGDVGVVVMADSAGGLLAALLLESLHDQGLRLPDGLVLLSPLLDLELTAGSVSENRDRDPLVKPALLKWLCSLAQGNGDERGPALDWDRLDYFPRTYLVASEDELLRDDSRRLESALARAHVPVRAAYWSGLFHAFPLLMDQLPEARQAMRDVKAWLEAGIGD